MNQNDDGAAESSSIDEYLGKRLKPVEGVIPRFAGIEMFGNSIPAANADGDLFEYINFQHRYNIDARIERASKLAVQFLEPLADGLEPRNTVDAHVQWLKAKSDYTQHDATRYRQAKSSKQTRIAETLQELYTTAVVLLVDAQGHGTIAARIASTVHDTFHTAMLCELDANGKATADVFEIISLRLAHSVSARSSLGFDAESNSREIATMVYGEILPDGLFRLVNVGHPPPPGFSAEYGRFMDIEWDRMVQFPSLGLEIPEDHADRSRYVPLMLRPTQMTTADLDEITLMSSGEIIFLYTDGVFDGSGERDKEEIERIFRDCNRKPAKDICNGNLAYALISDGLLRETGQADLIDDETVFIIKRLDTKD